MALPCHNGLESIGEAILDRVDRFSGGTSTPASKTRPTLSGPGVRPSRPDAL
jgi:hypothetical protein